MRSWFVYVVALPDNADRERVIAHFEREAIGFNRYLPSIHLQPYMRERYGFGEGLCPVSEDSSSRTLALRSSPRSSATRRSASPRRSRRRCEDRVARPVEPFVTKDGSTIRELHHTEVQSLAEATLEPGQATERHQHRPTEEIYFVLKGSGRMEVDGDVTHVAPGDADPHSGRRWHTLENNGTSELRILCCCAPPYSDDDTFFE